MDAKYIRHRSSSRLGLAGALVLAAGLLIPFGSATAGQVLMTPGGQAASQEEILRVSREWFTALMSADREALLRLETDDFLMVQRTATGIAVVSKESQLEALAKADSNRPLFERELLNVKVRRYGPVAVLTGLARFSGRVNDRPVVSQAVESEVWVLEAGRWRLAHYQTTEGPSPVTP